MDEHRGFIRAILNDPEDTTSWLVYADWLEERGDPRGEFVRLTVALAGKLVPEEQRPEAQARIRELRGTCDTRWLALLDRARIELCWLCFAHCPARWERLQLTDDEFVRFCGDCEKEVHYCRSLKQVRRCASQGFSVTLDPALPRKRNDLWGFGLAIRWNPLPPSPAEEEEDEIPEHEQRDRNKRRRRPEE